jgi:hypothetical protein
MLGGERCASCSTRDRTHPNPELIELNFDTIWKRYDELQFSAERLDIVLESGELHIGAFLQA